MSVDGDDVCHNQCDLRKSTEEAMEGWWYEPSKNKWKLRKKFRNRQVHLRGEPESEAARRQLGSDRTGGLEVRRQLERRRLRAGDGGGGGGGAEGDEAGSVS